MRRAAGPLPAFPAAAIMSLNAWQDDAAAPPWHNQNRQL
jgi:hypothetical protein